MMHPGPMIRGMEITADVADSARSVIVEQVTNGVAVRMAVLYLLLGRLRARRHDRSEKSEHHLPDQERRRSSAASRPTCCSRTASIAEIGDRPRPAGGRRGHRRRPAWSPCPAWSTCTPTCASPAARTPRPSRPAPSAAALGGFTAVHAMANTDPVADTAGVVEQVWRLGREAGYCDVYPIGAVTVGLAGEQLAELGAMADSAARVRVFSDDGKCVSDAGADAPGAGVRQGVRRRRRPARPGAAAHRGRPDERGRAVRPARPGRLAGGRRGGDHRPRLPARRARRLPAARLPRVHRRLGRDRPLGQGARAGTSPPRSPRTTCC